MTMLSIRSIWNSPRIALATAIVSAAASFLAPTSASALEIRTVENSEATMSVVSLSGSIERGDAQRVQAHLAQMPRGRPIAVQLHSGGGSIDEALTMGLYFNANGIHTYVSGKGQRCLSACALAFLGGRDATSGRTSHVKSTEAALGFQGIRTVVADAEFTVADMQRAFANTQNTLLRITDYLVEVGADIEFLSLMLSAPHTKMNFVTNEKAAALGIHILRD